MLLHYPVKHGNIKSCIFTQMLYSCFAVVQQVTALFLQYNWLATDTHTAVWLLKYCSQWISALGWWGS